MERLVRGISGAVIRWVEMRLTPVDQRGSVARGQVWEQLETESRRPAKLVSPESEPLFTPFYPSGIGDPFGGIFSPGVLMASMARFRQQESKDAGSVDTGQGRE